MDVDIQIFKEKSQNKKIVIIYGNCHTTAISHMLSKCPQFCKDYIIYPTKAIQDIDNSEYFKTGILKICDIFIHQSIQKNNRYGAEFSSEEIIKLLKPGCQIIAIPNVYHLPLCFFPQYLEKKDFINRKGNTIFFRDSILDNVFIDGGTLKEAQKQYENKNLYNNKELQESFNTFLKKVQAREKEWDIKISDFILNNYKTSLLFFDPNHPTPFFINFIVKELLSILSVPFEEELFSPINDMRLDAFEMPICESVRNHFFLSFETNEYRVSGNKVKSVPIHLRDYIKQYYSLEWQNSEMNIQNRMKSFLIFTLYKMQNIFKKFKR